MTSRVSRHWLIPKGWPMRGKSDAASAAQEAFEEAGIRGAISAHPIGSYEYDKVRAAAESLRCAVDVYSLEVTEELSQWPEAGNRERRWVPLDQAARLVFEPGLAAMLSVIEPDRLATPATETKRSRRRKG